MSQFIERERAAVSLAIATVTMIAAQVVTFLFNHRSKNIIIHVEYRGIFMEDHIP